MFNNRQEADAILDCRYFDHEKKKQSAPSSEDFFDPENHMLGRSVGGLDTSITIGGTITLDAGPSIADIEPEDNVFISHTDEDHFSGLAALMCMSTRREKPYELYISEKARDSVKEVERSMAINEGIKVHFNFVSDGDSVDIDSDTRYEFFEVPHAPSSLGISVSKRNKETGLFERELTYTGDISIKRLREEDMIEKTPQILSTKTLIIENSMPSQLEWMAPVVDLFEGNHSTISDVEWLAKRGRGGRELDIDNLILIHTFGLPDTELLVLGCDELERDMEERFGDCGFDSYYLTTCRGPKGINDGLKGAVKIRRKTESFLSEKTQLMI